MDVEIKNKMPVVSLLAQDLVKTWLFSKYKIKDYSKLDINENVKNIIKINLAQVGKKEKKLKIIGWVNSFSSFLKK